VPLRWENSPRESLSFPPGNAPLSSTLSFTVSVIDVATNAVIATIPVGAQPYCVAITPNGKHVYVANVVSNAVSVIDTMTHTVVATVPVGNGPSGVGIGWPL
jgi:YVTN family beta-propeller protein